MMTTATPVTTAPVMTTAPVTTTPVGLTTTALVTTAPVTNKWWQVWQRHNDDNHTSDDNRTSDNCTSDDKCDNLTLTAMTSVTTMTTAQWRPQQMLCIGKWPHPPQPNSQVAETICQPTIYQNLLHSWNHIILRISFHVITPSPHDWYLILTFRVHSLSIVQSTITNRPVQPKINEWFNVYCLFYSRWRGRWWMFLYIDT